MNQGRPIGSGGQAKELSDDEIKRIDKCLTGTFFEHRNRALFYLGLRSGMRISELCGLTVGDVRDSLGEVLEEVVLEKHSTKSKKSRTVYLSSQAQKTLQLYFEKPPKNRLETFPLFPNRRGKSLTANAAVTVLKKMFDQAGIKHASSHSRRRTHANALRRRGVDLKIIQEQLGHSSLATTERYFQVDPLEAKLAVKGLKF